MAKPPISKPQKQYKISEADQLAKVQPMEILGLFSAGFFVHSVATDAHHALSMFRYRDLKIGSLNIEIPSSQDLELSGTVFLIFTLLVVVYYFAKRKTLSHIAIASLMLIVGALYVWGFGLRANI